MEVGFFNESKYCSFVKYGILRNSDGKTGNVYKDFFPMPSLHISIQRENSDLKEV